MVIPPSRKGEGGHGGEQGRRGLSARGRPPLGAQAAAAAGWGGGPPGARAPWCTWFLVEPAGFFTALRLPERTLTVPSDATLYSESVQRCAPTDDTSARPKTQLQNMARLGR